MGSVFSNCMTDKEDNKKKQKALDNKQAKKEPTEFEVALAGLLKMRDQLVSKTRQLQVQMDKSLEKAKQHLQQNKKQLAKEDFEMKKMYEKYHKTSSDKLLTVNNLISTLEEQQMDLESQQNLKNAVNYMKEVQQNLDLQEVFEDYQEYKQNQKQVEAVIGKFNESENQQYEKDFEDIMKQFETEQLNNQINNIPQANQQLQQQQINQQQQQIQPQKQGKNQQLNALMEN